VKQRVHEPLAETLRDPGAILLVSCYGLGHQPLGLASPLGFLERAGFTPEALDIAVERFDREKFPNGPGHSLAIVRTMHQEFPEITFDFTAKVEHILERRAIFPELGALGCVFMVSAVESLSDVVLANLEKGHTRADVYEALRIVRDAAIAFRPTWVAFTPWTTLDDYLEILDFVETEGLIDHVDPVQYTIRLLVPPRSALLDRPAIRPFLGPLDQASFSYRWTNADPRMDRLHESVCPMVEEATRAEEDPALTFVRVRELAETMAGLARSESPGWNR